MSEENTIKLTDDNNIVIQDAQAGNITINQNDQRLTEKLQKLNEEQIAVLQQMLNEQSDKFTDLFKNSINKITNSKNIVQNSTINAKLVKIGDEIYYHYHYPDKNIVQNFCMC